MSLLCQQREMIHETITQAAWSKDEMFHGFILSVSLLALNRIVENVKVV